VLNVISSLGKNNMGKKQDIFTDFVGSVDVHQELGMLVDVNMFSN